MKTNTDSEKAGLNSLVTRHTAAWRSLNASLDAFTASLGFRIGDKFSDFIITAADFTAAGFQADEADALIFLLASEGCNNADEIEGWLARNKAAVRLL